MRTVRRLFNMLVLLSMALGLVLAPTGSASADTAQEVFAPEVALVEPSNAEAGAHFVFVFQTTTPLPLSGEIRIQWPEAYRGINDDQIYNLADNDLDSVYVSWKRPPATSEDVYTDTLVTPPNAGTFRAVDGMNTAKTQPWIPDGEVRLTVDPGGGVDELPAGTWMRVDFWGPASENPGFTNAGLENPDEADNYCWNIMTDEDDFFAEACYDIDPPLAVRLWRKIQVPTYGCGYKDLEYIAGFETITEALTAANHVWRNTGDFTDDPGWNLYRDCPTLDNLINDNNQPGDAPGSDLKEMVLKAAKGVAVGAVIEVDAGAYGGPLHVDTPGLMVGSVNGPMSTTVTVDSVDANSNYTAAVNIDAGGITFGEFVIGDEVFDGFDIEVTNPVSAANVVKVWPHGYKSDDYAYEEDKVPTVDQPHYNEIYEPVVDALGVLSDVNFTVWTNTVDFTDVTTAPMSMLVFTDTNVWMNGVGTHLSDGDKLANLTTGWSGHTVVEGCDWATHEYTNTGPFLCVALLSPEGDPIETDTSVGDVTSSRWKTGNAFALFNTADPSAVKFENARVDVRGNVLHGGTLNGIAAYSAPVWVDGNEVYDNMDNGFYGEDLWTDHEVICDGNCRDGLAARVSNNRLYHNGSYTQTAWMDMDEGCFKPVPYGRGSDAGVFIQSAMGACVYPLTIDNNAIFENHATGIWLATEAADAAGGVDIVWNDIRDNDVFGLSNWASANSLADWSTSGLKELHIDFMYNDVTGNDAWGVKNWVFDYEDDGDLYGGLVGTGERGLWLDAKENFWNEVSEDEFGDLTWIPGGPSVGPVACSHYYDQRQTADAPMGEGDAVSKGTYYDPWLTVQAVEGWDWVGDGCIDTYDHHKALMGTGADGWALQHVRAYGSDNLELQAGWNTLATPLPLDSGYDELEEISTLGSFMWCMGEPKWEMAYRYDNVNDSWDPIDGTGSDPIEAAHGYFIKMAVPTKFPVIYGKTFMDLPEYELTQGWNLIGSAFGIDRDPDGETSGASGTAGTMYDDQGRYAVAFPSDTSGFTGSSDEGRMKLKDALVSIAPSHAGDGVAMVVNPGVAGQEAVYWTTPWQVGDVEPVNPEGMYVGEAYWVFMREAGLYGGFESAPLFFD